MSRTVYKYELSFLPTTIVGGDPLVVHVGIDPNGADLAMPTVWVEIDPEGKGSITLCFIGTGHPVSVGWRHVGSVITGPYVWHVYQQVADE